MGKEKGIKNLINTLLFYILILVVRHCTSVLPPLLQFQLYDLLWTVKQV